MSTTQLAQSGSETTWSKPGEVLTRFGYVSTNAPSPALIGAVVGSIVGALVVIGVVWYICFRRRRQRERRVQQEQEDKDEADEAGSVSVESTAIDGNLDAETETETKLPHASVAEHGSARLSTGTLVDEFQVPASQPHDVLTKS